MTSASLHSDSEPSVPHTRTRTRCTERDVTGAPGQATNTDSPRSTRPFGTPSTSQLVGSLEPSWDVGRGDPRQPRARLADAESTPAVVLGMEVRHGHRHGRASIDRRRDVTISPPTCPACTLPRARPSRRPVRPPRAPGRSVRPCWQRCRSMTGRSALRSPRRRPAIRPADATCRPERSPNMSNCRAAYFFPVGLTRIPVGERPRVQLEPYHGSIRPARAGPSRMP